jgi:hypothetical protein
MPAGCATRATLRPEDEIYPHTKVSIGFTIPAGWRVSPEEHQAEFKTALVPTNGDRVVISLLSSRNTWEEQTEEKSAQEFLHYIRGAHDPNASLQIIGSFDSGRYGPRHLYHCCTNYNSFVNNWLVVFLTEGPNTVDIEAWTPACDDATRYKGTVEALARTVSINNL